MAKIIDIFHPIPGFETNYSITINGIIKSLERVVSNHHRSYIQKERILKQYKDKDGYLIVYFFINKKILIKKVHRLVMLTFFGESELSVNHLDGDKTNNNLSNLEYATTQENIRHQKRIVNPNKVPGVNWHEKTGSWMARFTLNKKRTHIGMFETEQGAANAVIQKMAEHNISLKY